VIHRLLASANAAARRLGQPAVGTGHLLLALLHDETCAATVLLRELGVDPSPLARSLESKLSEEAPETIDGPVRFGPGATLDGNRTEEFVRAGTVVRLPQDPNRLPQTVPLKRSLERAVAEAQAMGPSRELPDSGGLAAAVGTEHVLLALMIHGGGVASTLNRAGVDAVRVRAKVAGD